MSRERATNLAKETNCGEKYRYVITRGRDAGAREQRSDSGWGGSLHQVEARESSNITRAARESSNSIVMEAIMDVQDRRVKRTQKALARALIGLTLEKGYEAITIRDITDRAEIGYATFFRHYRDKDALLKDVLDVVLDELMGLLQAPMQDTDHAAAGTLIFKYVKEHSEVVHVLLSSRESSSMMHRIIEAGVQSVFSQNIPSSE